MYCVLQVGQNGDKSVYVTDGNSSKEFQTKDIDICRSFRNMLRELHPGTQYEMVYISFEKVG